MRTSELTLDKVREVATKPRSFRASDFLSEDDNFELKLAAAIGKPKKRNFDEVDAYQAEILSRFGWEAYQAWLKGDIPEQQMVKWVEAERVRDLKKVHSLKQIIVATCYGANNADKNGRYPKSARLAVRILNSETKQINGSTK